MEDEKDNVVINLKALTKDARNIIKDILEDQLEAIPDETNETAKVIIEEFEED